jgi:hypothetical protein
LEAGFPVKELEFTSFAGDPVYFAAAAPDRTRIVPVRGQPLAEFGRDRILDVVRTASQPGGLAEVRMVTKYDSHYLDRRGQRPLPVIYVQLKDANDTGYYIDPKTARVVGNRNNTSRSWVNRWLYHGLHSLDFPWLYNYRPAWDIVVLVLMLGGTALCVTSIIIGWQLLHRKLAPR